MGRASASGNAGVGSLAEVQSEGVIKSQSVFRFADKPCIQPDQAVLASGDDWRPFFEQISGTTAVVFEC